jgi:hypothetical protein
MYFNGKKLDDALADYWFFHLNTNLELLLCKHVSSCDEKQAPFDTSHMLPYLCERNIMFSKSEHEIKGNFTFPMFS